MATPPSTIIVSAHRGGAGQWPQNSLLAFGGALAANYDEIEGDVWVTQDGQTVVYHDMTISASRCPGKYAGRFIRRLTAAQVGAIRCQHQPIPTEKQLLDLVRRNKNSRTVLRLETKTYPGQSARSARAWAHLVGAQVAAAGLERRAIMEDMNWVGIAGYHSVSPALRVSALIFKVTAAAIARAASLGAYDVSYDARYSTPAINADITAHHLVPTVFGSDAVPATHGQPTRAVATFAVAAFRRLSCQGMKVVITNYPKIITAARDTPLPCTG